MSGQPEEDEDITTQIHKLEVGMLHFFSPDGQDISLSKISNYIWGRKAKRIMLICIWMNLWGVEVLELDIDPG